jgi:hypothetical protein
MLVLIEVPIREVLFFCAKDDDWATPVKLDAPATPP